MKITLHEVKGYKVKYFFGTNLRFFIGEKSYRENNKEQISLIL